MGGFDRFYSTAGAGRLACAGALSRLSGSRVYNRSRLSGSSVYNRPMPDPIAVIAANERAARDAARRLSAASGIRGSLEPFTPASYLRAAGAPSRIVLCAPSGAANAAAFLRRWAERLLWPAPPSELHDAVDGI